MSQPFSFRWHGQHNTEHTEYTFESTNWAALLQEVRNLTNGRHCDYEGCYHAGGRHIVRRLLFSDGELWLARVPVVSRGSATSSWWTKEQQFAFENEIATMKYLTTKTTLPIPVVFGYQASLESNPVKIPYLLMQCFRGNMLYDLGNPKELSPEHREKIRRSIASIQCQMATICLDKIGSLVLGPRGKVEIGPLPAPFGFQGPFSSPIDYFVSWAAHAKFRNTDFLRKRPEDDETIRTLQHEVECFPSKLVAALKKKPPLVSTTGYPLIHWDFLPHNILFDEQYNIVGLPDWENTYSAPFEAFVANTNMYSHFDSKKLQMVPNEQEGVEYMADIIREEERLQLEIKISSFADNTLCDICYCMSLFENGSATRFSQLLDRYQKD